MRELEVNSSARTYAVSIGRGLLETRPVPEAVTGPILIVTDEQVAPLYLDRLLGALGDAVAGTLILPAGESAKTLASVERIWSAAADAGLTRDGCLVSLGGGVIGDMTGFAAATWMRGIDFVQIPTTLLAQVDASVGGKTGINLGAGKNLVGAFRAPAGVTIDIDVLETLPEREYRAGLAEIVKAALLASPDLLVQLEANIEGLATRDPELLESIMESSVRIKANIVSADEFEAGQRAVLNLGHTFAHALEKELGYGNWLHGEAVSVGLVLAARLSVTSLGADAALPDRICKLLLALGLPVALPPSLNRDALLGHMALDKKAARDHWRLILLRGVGQPVIQSFHDSTPIAELLARA